MNTQAIHPERRRHERRMQPQGQGASKSADGHAMHKASYLRFTAMVAVSTAIGFIAMYMNTYALDHVYFSRNRLFMAIIMGGVMTAVMMLFMWQMYPNKRANFGVLGVAALLFLSGLALVRTQATVEDVAWMKSMIPHHSIAILTSTKADISDPRVRELADGIIETQREEIAQMQALLRELESR